MSQNENFKDDFYALLGVDPTADAATIKAAYIEKSRYYFPDFGNVTKEVGEAMQKLLNEANEVLSDPDRKTKYDAFWNRIYKGRKAITSGQAGTIARPEDVQFKDYYNALNVDRRTATDESITGAYLAVLNQFRPQLDGENREVASNIIACAEEAYGVLSRRESRELYNVQYDKVNIAKLSETPRVRGEITVVRPTQMEVGRPSETQVSTYRQVSPKLATVNQRTTTPIVREQRETIVLPYKNRSNVVATINREILSKNLLASPQASRKITIRNLYALISEDDSFQFVHEIKKFDAYLESYYYLIAVPGDTKLSEDYSVGKRPWARQEVITLRGLRSLVIPAVKLIPPDFINLEGFFDAGDYIRYNDLRHLHSQILQILSTHPGMMDAYFDRRQGKHM